VPVSVTVTQSGPGVAVLDGAGLPDDGHLDLPGVLELVLDAARDVLREPDASSSLIFSLSTMMRISRPAWSANDFDDALEGVGDAFELLEPLDVRLEDVAAAPGRAAEIASAACTIIASSDGQSMSMWCAAMACSTGSTRRACAGSRRRARGASLHLAVDRLADVVQERGAHGDVPSSPSSRAMMPARYATSLRVVRTFWP
jgi:hypothetical protein